MGAVTDRILSCYLKGNRGQVDRVDAGPRPLESDREADCTGAGSHVEHEMVIRPRNEFQGPFDDHFGFGTRDQDSGGQVEFVSVELRFAKNVLEGFPLFAAAKAVFEAQPLCCIEDTIGGGIQVGA